MSIKTLGPEHLQPGAVGSDAVDRGIRGAAKSGPQSYNRPQKILPNSPRNLGNACSFELVQRAVCEDRHDPNLAGRRLCNFVALFSRY